MLEKKSDFKTICFKKNQKILRCNSRRKLQKHGKKKNDKDEFGNILLKHVLPVYNLALKKRGGGNHENVSDWSDIQPGGW